MREVRGKKRIRIEKDRLRERRKEGTSIRRENESNLIWRRVKVVEIENFEMRKKLRRRGDAKKEN